MKKTIFMLGTCLLPLLGSAQTVQRSLEERLEGMVLPTSVERQVEAPAPDGKKFAVSMEVAEAKVTFRSNGMVIVAIPPSELEALVAIVTKYEEWLKIAREKNVQTFARVIGKLRGQEVLVRWYQEDQTLELFLPKPDSVQEKFRLAHVNAIRELAKQYPEARVEVEKLNAIKAKEQELFK